MSVAVTAAPADLYITSELYRRTPKAADPLGEKLALQDIAAQLLEHPDDILARLVERAMDLTGALSAGISEFEPGEGTAGLFRWRDLRGELARFAGSTTPRDFSPCGVCLDRLEPTLTRRPERYYSWIADAGISCPEVLLAPLTVANGQPLGTLWVVAEREGLFDGGDARVLRELASFVGVALAVLQDKRRLQDAVKQQEMLAGEMSHRVKNLFAVVDAMIHISKRSATSPEDMAKSLSGRLHALATAHALVRRSFDPGRNRILSPRATLGAVVGAILRPYETAAADRFSAAGPEVDLGEKATTSLALAFHELATNAAKYGALSADEGRVSIRWRRREGTLAVEWRESGGPRILAQPRQQGFGSALARDAITRQFGGTLTLVWREQGLAADMALPLAKLAD